MHLCNLCGRIGATIVCVIEGQLRRTNKLCSVWFWWSNCVDSWSGWGKEKRLGSELIGVGRIEERTEQGGEGQSQWVWSTSSRGWMCCARNMRSMTSISSEPPTLCRGMTNFWSFTHSSRLTSRPLFRYLCVYVCMCGAIICSVVLPRTEHRGLKLGFPQWSGENDPGMAVVWKREQLTRNLMLYASAVFLLCGVEGRAVDSQFDVIWQGCVSIMWHGREKSWHKM